MRGRSRPAASQSDVSTTGTRSAHASPYLTTDEAADYLKLAGGSSVRALVARGDLLPSGRRGVKGPYVFVVADLNAWLLRCLERAPGSSLASDKALGSARHGRCV
jgi:hypothetical protein